MPVHCSDVIPPKEPSPANDLAESWLPTWRRPDALWVDFGMPCPICNETMAPFPAVVSGNLSWRYECRTPQCLEIMSGVLLARKCPRCNGTMSMETVEEKDDNGKVIRRYTRWYCSNPQCGG